MKYNSGELCAPDGKCGAKTFNGSGPEIVKLGIFLPPNSRRSQEQSNDCSVTIGLLGDKETTGLQH